MSDTITISREDADKLVKYEAMLERRRELARARYAAHREELLAKSREYYNANKEQRQEYQRNYYYDHVDIMLPRQKEYARRKRAEAKAAKAATAVPNHHTVEHQSAIHSDA